VLAASGEARRLAGDAGAALCVTPGNAEELAAAVRRLRDDEALRDRLAARARTFAEGHTREVGVAALEALVAKVAQRR
jgi:glycosyltransferase involved in cell wall biosynthesis